MRREMLEIALGAALLVACADKGDQKSGCTKDTECKGDRVCELGRCVSASAKPESAASSSVEDCHPSSGSISEAKLQLSKLGKEAKIYFDTTSSFPVGRVGLTPSLSCRDSPGSRCRGNASDWTDPIWKKLDFEIDVPHVYQYSYVGDRQSFTAKAVGDPECTGKMIVYELQGRVVSGNADVRFREPGR